MNGTHDQQAHHAASLPTQNHGLVRSIGLVTAVLLVISQMIGSGVFKKITQQAAAMPSPSFIMLAWLLAGSVSLVGALTNAEVCGIIADPGGQYAYFRKMYGRFFAFLFGWASFSVIQSATIASVAYVFAQSVNTLLPLPRLDADLEAWTLLGLFSPLSNIGVKALTVGIIALLTFINVMGVEYGSKVSDILASVITVAIILIIIAAFSSDAGSWSHITQDAPMKSTGDSGGYWSGLFPAMMAAFWAYEGWNNMGYMGGEIKNPERNIPVSLILGVGFVMLLYTTVNLAYLYVLPVEQLQALAADENSIGAVAVMEAVMGRWGVLLVSGLILIATLNSTNGVILTASRLYYAMALDQQFFKAAAYCHPVRRSPSGSLVLQGLWASVLVVSASFDILTDLLVFAAFLFYGAMAAGVFVLRNTMSGVPRPVKALGYPVLPALFVLFCFALVVFTMWQEPVQSLVGLSLIAAGIPFYFYWQSRRTVPINR